MNLDNASTYGTLEYLKENDKTELDKSWINLHKLEINSDVTGAKNKGIEIANEEWVIL